MKNNLFDFLHTFKQNAKHMTDMDEVVIEPEEENGEATSHQKLKKLRQERDEARKEAQEYLTGWQRSKADYVNLSKRAREAGEDVAQSAVTSLAQSIITVFDSLEAALKAAEDAPESVHTGIEQVAIQLENALKEHGIVRFSPKTGDAFEPEKHEPMQTVATEDESQDNTVAEVFQSGYEARGTVIRAARVTVNKFNN